MRWVKNIDKHKYVRRQLRKNATPAEARLWTLLKNQSVNGLTFRRQFSVGVFILDFYCPSLHLCIELDGNPHFLISGKIHDNVRDEYLLMSHGITVLRFENKVVFESPQKIIDAIIEFNKNIIPQVR